MNLSINSKKNRPKCHSMVSIKSFSLILVTIFLFRDFFLLVQCDNKHINAILETNHSSLNAYDKPGSRSQIYMRKIRSIEDNYISEEISKKNATKLAKASTPKSDASQPADVTIGRMFFYDSRHNNTPPHPNLYSVATSLKIGTDLEKKSTKYVPVYRETENGSPAMTMYGESSPLKIFYRDMSDKPSAALTKSVVTDEPIIHNEINSDYQFSTESVYYNPVKGVNQTLNTFPTKVAQSYAIQKNTIDSLEANANPQSSYTHSVVHSVAHPAKQSKETNIRRYYTPPNRVQSDKFVNWFQNDKLFNDQRENKPKRPNNRKPNPKPRPQHFNSPSAHSMYNSGHDGFFYGQSIDHSSAPQSNHYWASMPQLLADHSRLPPPIYRHNNKMVQMSYDQTRQSETNNNNNYKLPDSDHFRPIIWSPKSKQQSIKNKKQNLKRYKANQHYKRPNNVNQTHNLTAHRLITAPSSHVNTNFGHFGARVPPKPPKHQLSPESNFFTVGATIKF